MSETSIKAPQPMTPEEQAMPAITVNGVVIDPAAIRREAANHPAPDAKLALEAAARALVVRELLIKEAQRLGVEASPERDEKGRIETTEDSQVTALLEKEISTPEIEESHLQRYYENNQAKFRSEDLYEASHILLPARPAEQDAYNAAVGQAENLIAELQARPERFADLAREFSACPSAATGGSLGQITKGQTVPEFETFLFNLEEGQLCPVPVRTSFGAHVVLLERKIPGRQMPFEMVREQIAEYLQIASWTQAVGQYISLLAAEAKIEGLDLQEGRNTRAFR
ncbi:peptidylprolyl isomerase [Limibacillus sp. MBR-115]|uniref:peptidylprolyl isomerase n=1 Tax=Limibacillus sp. MBR-115 TaxID=3156465 RepID=UPI00339129BC